jgi:hypothetical protein
VGQLPVAGVPKQRWTPLLSGLQHWNLGEAQPQQSCRAFTPPSPTPPHTLPGGSQLCGLRQRPTFGVTVVSSTHAPAPDVAKLQQSWSL